MNDMTVICPNCNSKFRIKEAFAKINKEFKCIKCQTKIPLAKPGAVAAVVHAAAPEPPPPPPPAPATEAAGATPPPAAALPAEEIVFSCLKCNREMRVPKIHVGKKVRCKQCGTIIAIPEKSATPLAPATATALKPEVPSPPPPSVSAPVVPSPPPPASKSTLPLTPPQTVSKVPVAPLATPESRKNIAAQIPVSPAIASATSEATPVAPVLAPNPLTAPPSSFGVIGSTADDVFHARITQLEAGLSVAQRRADTAERELQQLAGQRTMETVSNQRRIAELENELHAAQVALRNREAETTEREKRLRAELQAEFANEIQTVRAEFGAHLQNYAVATEALLAEMRNHLTTISRG